MKKEKLTTEIQSRLKNPENPKLLSCYQGEVVDCGGTDKRARIEIDVMHGLSGQIYTLSLRRNQLPEDVRLGTPIVVSFYENIEEPTIELRGFTKEEQDELDKLRREIDQLLKEFE